MSKFFCVDPRDVERVWPHIEPMLAKSYAEVDEVMPDILSQLRIKHALAWVQVDSDEKILAALVTELVVKPGGLACRMKVVGGGAMDLWKHHHATIEQYAKAEGCYKVYADGREGWARVLGYDVVGVRLEKRIG